MLNREAESSRSAYRELRLRALEHQIDDATGQLGKIYAGPKVSDKEYAKLSRRLLKESAMMLFGMQVFPVVGLRQETVRDCKLGFSLSGGATHYLDLEGRIFSHPETTKTISDPNFGEIILLSKDLLVQVDDTGYRKYATRALDAMRDRARAHLSEIEPPRPVRNMWDIKRQRKPFRKAA